MEECERQFGMVQGQGARLQLLQRLSRHCSRDELVAYKDWLESSLASTATFPTAAAASSQASSAPSTSSAVDVAPPAPDLILASTSDDFIITSDVVVGTSSNNKLPPPPPTSRGEAHNQYQQQYISLNSISVLPTTQPRPSQTPPQLSGAEQRRITDSASTTAATAIPDNHKLSKMVARQPAKNCGRNPMSASSSVPVFTVEDEDEEADDDQTPPTSSSASVDVLVNNGTEDSEAVNNLVGLAVAAADIEGQANAGNWKDDKRTCPACNKEFFSLDSLKEHYKSNQGHEQRKLKCDRCIKVFPSVTALKKHKRIHSSTLLTCLMCYEQFATSSNLANHIKICFKASLSCDVCDRRFKNQITLNKHKKKHTEAQHPCDICNKEFISAVHMATHRESSHGLETPAPRRTPAPLNFLCHHCDKKFSRETALKSHLIRHENPERLIACDECGKAFLRETSLNKHKRIVHTGREIQCSRCPRVFKTPSSLALHFRNAHDASRMPFECDICQKRFSKKAKLDHHRTVLHLRHRPFPCRFEECSRDFFDSSNRNTHERRTHGSVFPKRGLTQDVIECDRCQRTFIHPKNLAKHKESQCGTIKRKKTPVKENHRTSRVHVTAPGIPYEVQVQIS